MAATTVRAVVGEGVLDANDALAAANRARCEQAGVAVVNIMSSPGAGKTTLLEQTVDRLAGTLRIGVIEGDVQTSLDADRLRRRGVPAVQISTEGFGASCHLDARMVQHGLDALPLADLDLLLIENVGNLVCPAEFALGEHRRVLVCSLPEGEEKPLKYPLMFRAADLVLVNKIDLAPYLGVDVAQLRANIAAVHPGVATHLVSARTGEGVEEWCAWLVDLTPLRAPFPAGKGCSGEDRLDASAATLPWTRQGHGPTEQAAAHVLPTGRSLPRPPCNGEGREGSAGSVTERASAAPRPPRGRAPSRTWFGWDPSGRGGRG